MQQIAIYTRVSTDDQDERSTIENQREWLHKFADLHQLTIVEAYADPAISGTIPLDKRPDGKRLLDDAKAGRFQSVVVYRVDRLARSLVALLKAYHDLDAYGVTIRSGTEPFDTSTPLGTFLFQLLGSLAELEKATITERFTMGRDRVARSGKWTNGPLPLGYDTDEDGCLIPSTRMVPAIGMTEHELAVDIFTRLAAGSTTLEVARWLNASGVPTAHRYANGTLRDMKGEWLPSRINYMVRNTVYKGQHVLKSQHGPVIREVPNLVDVGLWDAANQQIKKNRSLPKGNQKRLYLLRGLLTCAECGCKFGGTVSHNSKNWSAAYYRCGSQVGALRPDKRTRCKSKMLHAERLEALIWKECKELVEDQDVVERLLCDLQTRKSNTPDDTALHKAIAAKAQENDRVITAYRKGSISLEAMEAQIQAVDKETADLRSQLTAIQSQRDINREFEAYINDWTKYREHLVKEWDTIERTDDRQAKKRTIDMMVAGIMVHTETIGKRKTATLEVAFRLSGDPVEFVWEDAGVQKYIYDSGPTVTFGEVTYGSFIPSGSFIPNAAITNTGTRARILCRD